MQQLLDQLGVDWHLLLSQAFNFALLLIVLRFYVYGPLLKLMRDRKDRIEAGLVKADEADKRLKEVDEIGKSKIKEAEMQSLGILKKTEGAAKELEEKLLAEAKRKEMDAMRSMDEALHAKEEESRRKMDQEAAALVKAAIVKAVEMAPEKIDDALIARAVKEAKTHA